MLAELKRALGDPEPLQGIAPLAARWADATSKTTGLGAERMARRLNDAPPDGERPLRSAVWALIRSLLSPRLAAHHADAFLAGEQSETTVDLPAHRGESTLDDLDLGDDATAAVAA